MLNMSSISIRRRIIATSSGGRSVSVAYEIIVGGVMGIGDGGRVEVGWNADSKLHVTSPL